MVSWSVFAKMQTQSDASSQMSVSRCHGKRPPSGLRLDAASTNMSKIGFIYEMEKYAQQLLKTAK